jgi:hypothetical protein
MKKLLMLAIVNCLLLLGVVLYDDYEKLASSENAIKTLEQERSLWRMEYSNDGESSINTNVKQEISVKIDYVVSDDIGGVK